MNDQLFGLPLAPFSAVPDVNLFVETSGACEAVHQLTRSLLRDDGIAVLTGDVGVGKTMIGKVLAERVSHKLRPLVLSSSNFPTRRALYQSVLFSLGRDFVGLSEQEARLLVLESSREQLDKRGNLVLIIDEAHLLTDRLLDEIRSLISNVDNGRLLVQVVLIGHSSLQERLKDPRFTELAHRIGCFVELFPMSQTETTDYVTRRLRLAGRDVFDVIAPGALQLITETSAGYPRCVNTLCDRAIGLAVESASPIVDEAIVRTALAELRQLPLAWSETSDVAAPVVAADSPDVALADHCTGDEIGADPEILPLLQVDEEAGDDAVTTSEVAVDLSPDEDWASFEIGADWPHDSRIDAPPSIEHLLDEGEFEEIPVFDPYAQFEALHGTLSRPTGATPSDPSPARTRMLPRERSSDVESRTNHEGTSTSSQTADLSDTRWFEEHVEESWPEVSVLEAIHELRAGLKRAVADELPLLNAAADDVDDESPVDFDVVEPEPAHSEPVVTSIETSSESQHSQVEENPVQDGSAETQEPPTATRFAGLFTRLRRKRAELAKGRR